jgi:hypothetical protein
VANTRGHVVGKPEQHYIFPKQFNEFFKERGIDINEYVVGVGWRLVS